LDVHSYNSDCKDASKVDIGWPFELKVREKFTSNCCSFIFSYISRNEGKLPAKNPIPLAVKYDPVKAVPAMRMEFFKR
jgi:hypothetical protein